MTRSFLPPSGLKILSGTLTHSVQSKGVSPLGPKETVSFEEVLVSNVFTQEALINLLEKKGKITKAELLEEIKALKEKQKR
jgi:phage-related minor tail protein